MEEEVTIGEAEEVVALQSESEGWTMSVVRSARVVSDGSMVVDGKYVRKNMRG